MSAPQPPADPAATLAAECILAMVVARDPNFPVSPVMHDATVALVHAVVSALARGGAR
jgi:hypothetical protein